MVLICINFTFTLCIAAGRTTKNSSCPVESTLFLLSGAEITGAKLNVVDKNSTQLDNSSKTGLLFLAPVLLPHPSFSSVSHGYSKAASISYICLLRSVYDQCRHEFFVLFLSREGAKNMRFLAL